MRIPKIIHMIWVGYTQPSETVQACQASWSVHSAPAWSIRVWRDEDITPANFPLTIGHIWRARNPAQAKDIMMFEILYREGGYYVDSDMMCLHRLENFVDPASRLVVTDEYGRVWDKQKVFESKDDLECSNSFAGCVQGHEMMLHSIMKIAERKINHTRVEINEETGPFFFGKCLKPFMGDKHTQALPPRALFSWLWNNPKEYILGCLEAVKNEDHDWDEEKNKDLLEFRKDFLARKVLGAHLWLKQWRNPPQIKMYGNNTRFSKLLVVIPFKASADGVRLRNLKTCLAHLLKALVNTTVAETLVVVSEQDSSSQIDPEKLFADLESCNVKCKHVFSKFDKLYFNRSLALNKGVEESEMADPFSSALMFVDADLIMDSEKATEFINDFTSIHCQSHAASAYKTVKDASEEQLVFEQPLLSAFASLEAVRQGVCAVSMCFIISKLAYGETGGWDESFCGWGGEDLDFMQRVYGALHRLHHDFMIPECLYIKEYAVPSIHLYHPVQTIQSEQFIAMNQMTRDDLSSI